MPRPANDLTQAEEILGQAIKGRREHKAESATALLAAELEA